MSRCAPAKVRNLLDAAKILFVLALLLAFGMRRGLAEVKDRLPWLGAALFALIVLTGGFLLVSAFIHRRRPDQASESGESDGNPPGPDDTKF